MGLFYSAEYFISPRVIQWWNEHVRIDIVYPMSMSS